MKWIFLTWKDATFFDGWSFVHLLWGMILGILFSYTKLSPIVSILISIALMFLWELFELVFGFSESWMNIAGDFLFAIVGFLIAYFILVKFNSVLPHILAGLVVLMLVLEYLGWTHYLKK